jgi:NitT/TauT family transport system substrate-binding protein
MTAMLAAAGAAAADPIKLRVSRPVDLASLPLLVMEREHLIERTAEAMGVGEVAVVWTAPGGKGSLDELAQGQADLAAAEMVPFLLAADSAAGTAAELRAVAALAEHPYILVTRNPGIRTLRDFGATDRIAVPALKISGPAISLEMAAAQEWGIERYDRLDKLLVAQPDDTAANMLLSGKGDIDAHFSRTPYADAELGDEAVHRVMDSFDIAGPHTARVIAVRQQFRKANPELCKAILSALEAADDLIKKDPGAAAETFAAAGNSDIPLEDVSDMIGDPDLSYRAAPTGLMRTAEFLARVGRLKHRLASWQDVFVPESRDLAGN